MIWPGTNRPPPIGSELDKGNGEADGVRGAEMRGAGIFREAGVAGGGGGGSVSPSPPADSVGSSPVTVAALSNSIGAPQDEQNRPFEEICAPQEEQNIGGRDSTTEAKSYL